MTSAEREFVHDYLSTACGHAQEPGREALHEMCQSIVGVDAIGRVFSRNPSRCKWCESPCRCECHEVTAAVT